MNESLLKGDILKFYDCSHFTEVGKFVGELWPTVLKFDRTTLQSVCRNGNMSYIQTDVNVAKGLIQELYAICRVTTAEPPAGENSFSLDTENKNEKITIQVLASVMMLRDPILRQAHVITVTFPDHRNKGWGSVVTACALYYIFTSRDIESIVAKVPITSKPGVAMFDKLMVPTGIIPYDWLYYGTLVPTKNYVLTIDALLFDRYDVISSTIKESGIQDFEVMNYDDFSALHLKE